MKIPINLICLLVIVNLNFSCVEKKATEKEISKVPLVSPEVDNRPTFTAGIRSILQDSKGNYWFGSHREGVCRYDGNSFEYFTMEQGLPDNQVRSIYEDKHGTIWFVTASGASSYDGKSISKQSNLEMINSPGQWQKTAQDLWMSAGNYEGVYRYDGHDLIYLEFPKPKVINPDNTYQVTDIAEGKNDRLWIATYAGVFGYNGNQFTLIKDETLADKPAINRLHIRSMLEDSKGRLWIGNNGIGVLLKEGDSTINFSEKMGFFHATSTRNGSKSPEGTLEHVFVISEDNDGNIWFGDRDTGPWKYDGKTMTNYTIDQNLASQMVWTIYENHDKNLLFGMEAGGVYQFDGKSFERRY